MGILSSIFNSVVSTVKCGNSATVYDFSVGRFTANPNFKNAFTGSGNVSVGDGKFLLLQIFSCGYLYFYMENLTSKYKDDYITVSGERMQSGIANLFQSVKNGTPITPIVHHIVCFNSMEYSDGCLVKLTAQVELQSGHRMTMTTRLPSDLFFIPISSLETLRVVPGFIEPNQ